MALSLLVLEDGYCSVGLWEALLGLWVHVLLFRRAGFGLLHAVFQVGRDRDERDVVVIPKLARDELTTLVAMASLFETDLRAAWAPDVSCTDASTAWGAVVTARVDARASAAVTRAGWEYRSKKRSYVRCLSKVDDARARLEYAEECGGDDARRHAARALRLELEHAAGAQHDAEAWRRVLSLRPGLTEQGAREVAGLVAGLSDAKAKAREFAELRVGLVLEEHEKTEAAWRRADARAQAWFSDFVRGVGWREEARFKLPPKVHINVKEVSARCADVRRRAASNVEPHGQRFLIGLDSLVALGACAKGRSSSWQLNAPMRRVVPDLLLGRLYPGEVYTPTEINPADCPTRGRRPPSAGVGAMPPWLLQCLSGAPVSLASEYSQCRERRRPKPALFKCALAPPLWLGSWRPDRSTAVV